MQTKIVECPICGDEPHWAATRIEYGKLIHSYHCCTEDGGEGIVGGASNNEEAARVGWNAAVREFTVQITDPASDVGKDLRRRYPEAAKRLAPT